MFKYGFCMTLAMGQSKELTSLHPPILITDSPTAIHTNKRKNKPAQIHIHMNNNINMDCTIAVSMNACS